MVSTMVTAISAVVIGASAGGVEALFTLLPLLPANTPFPVIVVLHLPPSPSLLVEVFTPRCKLPVNEPLDKQNIARGIWFAPPGYHLLIEKSVGPNRSFAMSADPPVNFSRPSIDVLFESAVDAYGAELVTIVLTGANDDGAAGARAARAAGGYIMVQDPNTAEARAMPDAAVKWADPHFVGSVSEIANCLVALATKAAAAVEGSAS